MNRLKNAKNVSKDVTLLHGKWNVGVRNRSDSSSELLGAGEHAFLKNRKLGLSYAPHSIPT